MEDTVHEDGRTLECVLHLIPTRLRYMTGVITLGNDRRIVHEYPRAGELHLGVVNQLCSHRGAGCHSGSGNW